jgi:hypothetical protein
MSFSQENGYIPLTIEQMVSQVRLKVNELFGTTYTAENFTGTNWYKFAYSVLQPQQGNETRTSEIFQKLLEYIRTTNEKIQRPSVSFPGIIEAFEAEEYVASVKAPAEVDAGKISICADISDDIAGKVASGDITITSYANLVSGTDDTVTVGATAFTAQTGAATPGTATFQAATSNEATATSLAAQINAHATAGALVAARAFGAMVVIKALTRGTAGNSIALGYTDNDTNVGATKSGTALSGGTDSVSAYADEKLAVATLIKDFVAAGLVTQGTEEEDITLSNGQEFTFKFYLPDRIPVKLQVTVNASENNMDLIPTDEVLRELIFDHISERYKVGYNFEPERYIDLHDVPWASDVLLEWSANNELSWNSTVFDAEFDEVFSLGLDDIDVTINT